MKRLRQGESGQLDPQKATVPTYWDLDFVSVDCAWSTTTWPPKLLRGPWTDEKHGLVYRLRGWGVDIDSGDPKVNRGIRDAIIENKPAVVELLIKIHVE